MTRLALYLLGSPRIERDGTVVRIRRRKAVALLAYLAVTGSSHSREMLATLLWPESDQSRALASLRVALGKALGEGWLAIERETLSLNIDLSTPRPQTNRLPSGTALPRRDPSVAGEAPHPGPGLWIDVHEFWARLAASRTHGHPPDDVCPGCPWLSSWRQLGRGC